MITDWIKRYKKAKNKLILLDYDGTLTDYTSAPEEAIPPPRLLHLLNKLNSLPKSRVLLISGRKKESIDNLFKNLTIDVVAEHGALIKQNNKWKFLISADIQWKDRIILLLNEFTDRCKGSFIEEKTFALAWHYRKVKEDIGYSSSRELISELKRFINVFHLKILDGNKVIEVINNQISKGNAVKYLTNQSNDACILCIGDDKTDEDMFKAFLSNQNAITIKVGEGDTFAKHKLKDVKEVITLLEEIAL